MARQIGRQRRHPSRRPPSPTAGAMPATRKLGVLGGIVVVCFLALSFQLVRLQIVNSGRYAREAEGNRLRALPITPPRGLMYDRNGKPLVRNRASYSAVLIPGDVPKDDEARVFSTVEDLLQVPVFEVELKVRQARERNDPLSPIVLKREVEPDTALVVAERRASLPGVTIRVEAVREYLGGPLMSQILGYSGPIEPDELKALTKNDDAGGACPRDHGGYRADDRLGKAGLENRYEGYLRGTPGCRVVEVDAAGRELRLDNEQAALPGANLVLSLDLDLQQAVQTILQESVRDLDSKKAVAIVMDVRTGELLADVSLPTFDNNIFSGRLDDAAFEQLTNNRDKPLLDHAIAEKFPPGSTFKIVTGLAALQEGIARPSTTITSNGALLVPREYDASLSDSFPDWRPGLGPLSFYRGIAMSSDIYFYCLAGGQCDELKTGLGNERLARYARNFGFGEMTGIDLPGETNGLVGDASWLKSVTAGAQNWFLADTFYMGIGQGYVEATPLQVVRLAAAVANGGNLLRPKVVREIRDNDGRVIVPAKTEVTRRISVSDANLAVMREAMRQAVADGTATTAQVPGLTVAGKTGTAEFGTRIGAGSVYGKYKEHGWFVGFAPFDEPEVAVVVFHEQGGGALTAAPTASRILKAWSDLKEQRAQQGR